MNQRIPILVYHHVYPDGAGELDVNKTGECTGVIAESAFRRQMQYLADNKMEVVSTSNVVDWLIDDAPLPEHAVVLHFDNGWLDTFTVTKPVLDSFGFTATCFVITDSANATSEGKRAAIRTKTEGIVEKPFMTWDQIRELVAAGWEIGAHTASHCRMADKLEAEGDEGGAAGGGRGSARRVRRHRREFAGRIRPHSTTDDLNLIHIEPATIAHVRILAESHVPAPQHGQPETRARRSRYPAVPAAGSPNLAFVLYTIC